MIADEEKLSMRPINRLAALIGCITAAVFVQTELPYIYARAELTRIAEKIDVPRTCDVNAVPVVLLYNWHDHTRILFTRQGALMTKTSVKPVPNDNQFGLRPYQGGAIIAIDATDIGTRNTFHVEYSSRVCVP